MRRARQPVGDLPFLVLGVGAQGGSLTETIRHGADGRGLGLNISSSRAISYAASGEDFAAARRFPGAICRLCCARHDRARRVRATAGNAATGTEGRGDARKEGAADRG